MLLTHFQIAAGFDTWMNCGDVRKWAVSRVRVVTLATQLASRGQYSKLAKALEFSS